MKRVLIIVAIGLPLMAGAWWVRVYMTRDDLADISGDSEYARPIQIVTPPRKSSASRPAPRATSKGAVPQQTSEGLSKIHAAIAASVAARLAVLAPVERSQDAAIRAALAMPGQWKVLPFEVGAHVEPNGRLWFSVPRDGATREGFELDFFRQIESLDLSNPDPPILRGGKILLIDRAGGIWVTGSAAGNMLRCFDSSKKKWTERRRSDGQAVQDSDVATISASVGEWNDTAFEDSAGNLHFIGGMGTNWGIHTRFADGHWTFTTLANSKAESQKLFGNVRCVEQPGGRICIYRPWGGTRNEKPRVVFFNGQQWSILSVEGCEEPAHRIAHVAAMPDGSIISSCSDDRCWIFWPSDALNSPLKRIPELIKQLDDPDGQKRDAATTALGALGAQAREPLQDALTQGLSPEAEGRVQRLLTMVNEGARGDHAAAGPQLGGRFKIASSGIVESHAGPGTWVWAEDVRDLEAARLGVSVDVSRALLSAEPDGSWTLHPVDTRAWGVLSLPDSWPVYDATPDPAGRLWTSTGIGLYLDENMMLQRTAPDGISVRTPDSIDRDGRVVFEFDRVIFDPSAAISLAGTEESFELWGLSHHSEAHEAWGMFRDDSGEARLAQVSGPGRPALAPPRPDTGSIQYIHPLSGGAITMPFVNSEGNHSDFCLWDGKTWHSSDSMYSLVVSNAATIARIAGSSFDVFSASNESSRLASDGKGRIWLWYDPPQTRSGGARPPQIFAFYDGKQWHDVWNEAGLKQANLLVSGGLDHGSAVLGFERSTKSLVRIGFENGQFVTSTLAKPTDKDHPLNPVSDVLEGPTATWIRLNSGEFYSYQNGAASETRIGFDPLVCDSHGCWWGTKSDDRKLQCRIGTIMAEIPDAPTGVEAVLETADGRVLVLDAYGATRVEVDKSSTPPVVRIAARFKWDNARNTLSDVFIDGTNSIWLRGLAWRATRITLPDTFWKNNPSK